MLDKLTIWEGATDFLKIKGTFRLPILFPRYVLEQRLPDIMRNRRGDNKLMNEPTCLKVTNTAKGGWRSHTTKKLQNKKKKEKNRSPVETPTTFFRQKL